MTMLGAAISACDKAEKWQHALGLLQGVLAQRLVPDDITASAALSACANGSQWQLVLHFFEQLTTWNLTPDKVMHSCRIKACAKGAQADRSVHFLSLMSSGAVLPNEICYTETWRAWQTSLFVDCPELVQLCSCLCVGKSHWRLQLSLVERRVAGN